MPPGLAHALLALAIQGAIALPLAFVLRDGVMAFAIGGGCAVSFYVGRERRQSEEFWGSNRIPPWLWRPRAFRDAGWPALAVTLVTCAVALLA